MEENTFILDLIAALQKSKSQEQLNVDIRQIEKTLDMLRLTATFAKADSKRELNSYIKQLSGQLSTIKLNAKIEDKNLKSEVNKALKNVSFKDIDALNIDGDKTKLKVQKVVADTKALVEKNPLSLGINIDSKRSKLDNDLTAYLNRNTKINESSILLEEADKVRDLIAVISDKNSLREATDAFQLYKSSVSAVGFNTKSTSDKIKDMFSHVTKIGSAFGIASTATNMFIKSLSTLRSNDTILTEISKTSELTKKQLQELGDESFKIASKYGQLSSDFLLATQEMARAGYDDNVKDMAELSTKVQGAGDMAAKLSNEYIIATDKAFKMNGSIEALTATLDGANNITNNNALSMSELGAAMSIVGSQAASSGMKVNETTAAVSTMIAVTQRSGSEMANAFKGILMNLRQVSGDVGDGEDIIDVESLTKYERACAELGVSLSTVKDGVVSLKEPMQIIKELSEAYTQLDQSDARRANLLSAVGGKYRANALNAILENYDMYDKMLKEYADGLGSMDVEAEKTANSWEGRLNSLSNSFTSFVNEITNKEAVLSGVTFLDKLVQGAQSFVDIFGTIPTVLTAVNSSMVMMNKKYGLTNIWDSENKKIDLEGNLFGIDFSAIKNQKKHFEESEEAIGIWNSKLKSGKDDIETFNYAVVQNNASLKEYLSTCSKDAPASLNGYKKYIESTGQATEDLRLKTILLNTALTFLGSIAVQAVITGIANAFDKFNETVEESKEKVDDINSKISDLKSEIEELSDLEYKSDFDKQKITQLERELELQERILEIEQKRLYQNQIGTRFSDYFDADSLVTKQQAEYDRNNKDGYSNLSRASKTYEASLNDIDAELDSLQEKLDSEDLIGHDRFMTEGKIVELTEKRNSLLEKQQAIEDQLTLNMGEYLANYQTAKEAADSGLLTGSDLEKAESMVAYWDQLYLASSEIVTNIQKMNGTYDNTDDLLEGMFGNISRDDLASLSDDDKRIALSFSPDNIIGFEELQQKIEETKDGIEGLNGTDISVDTVSLSDNLTASEESLDKFQESIKSASEAYAILLSGDYSSTELLDCIQTINKAVSDMGGSLNWEFINSQTDSLELLGDAVQHISQKYAESILSGAGIDTDSGLGQMLTGIIQQIYDTEAAFDSMNLHIDALQASYQTLTGILASYNQTGYISLDNLQSLLTADSNLIAMLQVENGQLVLNQTAYENLVQAQLMGFKVKLDDAAAAEIEALAKAKAEEATDRNADASSNAVAKLDAETDAFNRNTSAAIANAVSKAEESGVSEDDIQEVFDKYNKVWEAAQENYGKDFSSFMGNTARSASKAAKETKKEVDIMAELNSEMDKLQSAFESLCDIRDTYNKYGKITVDQYQELTNMGFSFLANLVDENGELGLNADAFEKLSHAKMQEMQIQMARNAIDTINGLESEIEATEYLTYANENLRDAALSATEALLYQAQAAARRRGEQQGLAADQIVQGYEASKMLASKVDFTFKPDAAEKSSSNDDLLDAYNEEKKLLEHLLSMDQISKQEYYDRLLSLVHQYFDGDEEHKDQIWDAEESYHAYLESIKETYNWIEIFLNALAKKTSSLIDKAEKFITWSKKNAMINRAVRAADREITGQMNAYAYYAEKARKVNLSDEYIRKIQDGTLTMEDMQNEKLSGKIEDYQEWYDKMTACQDAVSALYDQERDLIKQKLDNVLSYYDDLDSYMSSIVSKMDSFISLMDDMGKRSSLTDLLEQFAATNEQISHFESKTEDILSAKEEDRFDSSRKVGEAKKKDTQAEIEELNRQKDALVNVQDTGTYKKLLRDIAKAEAAYDKQYEKLWSIDPEKDKNGKKWEAAQKKLDKLGDKLDDLNNKKDWLEQGAAADTVVDYAKKYDAYMKLLAKEDSGKPLSAKEEAKKDLLFEQILAIEEKRKSDLAELDRQIGLLDGSVTDDTEAEKIKQKLSAVDSGVKDSAAYKNLEKDIEAVEAKIDKFWDTHDGATDAQQRQLDKWEAQLEAYYEKQKQLEENATAETVSQYSKIYDAWKKLQDKLDSGKVLSVKEWQKYNDYTAQLEQFAQERSSIIDDLNAQLEKALNPGDKIAVINREYEEAAKGIYDSYQNQIDGIGKSLTDSKQYKDLLAKKQNLENIRDTKGLSASQEKLLRKYTEELEALERGGTGDNVSSYIKAWEKFYSLQQKLDSGKKLSASEAADYDTLKAQLDAWDKEKQEQISDLLSLMEDDLEKLREKNSENIAEAEAEINSYYSDLYGLAKQIAEYNITALKEQLSYLDAYISYYKELVSLYDSFSGDKLSKLLTDLDEDAMADQTAVYEKYLKTLETRYDATLSQIGEYRQLIEAIDTNDFAGSMDLFKKAMDDYTASGNTAMAEKLKSVLDLLNERAVDADNWEEYADLWLNEWEQALADAKAELIDTAGSIQDINDALREIKFSVITDGLEELSRADDILSSMLGLIREEWLYEDGALTEYGSAKLALLVSQLENAQEAADKYLTLYNEILENKDTYASEKAYQEELYEAMKNYYSSLNGAASLEDSIMDVMKKAEEAELSGIKDIIEARKKALQAKKEYYDYGKKLSDSQKEIDSIKAQIDALENLSDATDAATKAKLAQLKAQLEEKETALQETKDDHTYNLQIDALDELAETLEDAIEDSTKSVKEILEDQKATIESAKDLFATSTDSVNETMDRLTAFYAGIGASIDGIDLTLSNKVSGKDAVLNASISPASAVSDADTADGVTSAIHETTEEVRNLRQEFAEGLWKELPDNVLFNTADSKMYEITKPLVNPIFDMADKFSDYINKLNSAQVQAQPIVINNHYDSLITVEGNVDKDFAGELKRSVDEMYGEFKSKIGRDLSREYRMVTGNNTVARKVM